MFRRFVMNILVLALSMGVFFIGIEIFFRIAVPLESRPENIPYIDDEYTGYLIKPKSNTYIKKQEFSVHITTNSYGLRDNEYSPLDKESFKILGLGDSFAFGWGVELNESFLSILEKRLNDSSDKYTVIKAGFPGYTLYQELMFLKEYGLAFDPKLVILEVSITNDIGGDPYYYKKTVKFPFKDFLKHNSYAYTFVRRKVAALLWDVNVKKKPLTGIELYALETDVSGEKKWQSVEGVFDEFVEIAKKNNFGLVIIAIPAEEAIIGTKRHSQLVNICQENHIEYDLLRPTKRLEEICAKRNVYFIDLLPSLQDYHNSHPAVEIHYPVDSHWTKIGHKIAAEAIYKFLLDKKLILL